MYEVLGSLICDASFNRRFTRIYLIMHSYCFIHAMLSQQLLKMEILQVSNPYSLKLMRMEKWSGSSFYHGFDLELYTT